MSDGKSGMMDSVTDAFKPGNVIFKFLSFVVFGMMTAFPYLIRNLNQVTLRVRELALTGGSVVWQYLWAFLGAVKTGFFIGLSTLTNTIFELFKGNFLAGDVFYSAVVFVFATLTVFQPIRLIMNALDNKKGRVHSRTAILGISALFVLVLIAPISWLVLDGETITSGIEDKDLDLGILPDLENITESLSDVVTIDLLDEVGDDSNETI